MPKRKRYGRKRKRSRRRYRRKRRKFSSMGTPSGMPTQRIAKLRYCVSRAMSSTLLMQSVDYNANSPFQPIAGSHQPMGWDQWALLYNHYVCLGSRITVQWALANQGHRAVVGVYLDDDATVAFTNFTQFKESKKGQQKLLCNQRNQVFTSGKFSAKKYFNVTDVKDNVTRIGANVESNPTDMAHYHIYFQGLETAIAVEAELIITIDYIVMFSEPKTLAQS